MLIRLQKQLSTVVMVAIGFWLFTVLMSALDIVTDLRQHVAWSHILLESTLFFACLFGGLVLGYLFYRGNLLIQGYLQSKLNTTKAEADLLLKEYDALMKGLAEQIKHQFMAWHLTVAEAEIGFLLIKGYSFKEISALRETSERTVREQARTIYQKSGVPNRSALTAYFLEDLLLPRDYVERT